MAEVTVFVDDAVLGRLPGRCARSGAPTADRLTVRAPVAPAGQLGVLWLLVLAGPLGWLALAAIAWSRGGRRELLTVELPFSAAAYDQVLSARRRSRSGVAVVGIGLVVFLGAVVWGPGGGPWTVPSTMGWLVMLAGLGLAVRGDRHTRAASVDVELDASRRWVTLRNVHPAFVADCRDALDRVPHRP